jgi:hypothetical protein
VKSQGTSEVSAVLNPYVAPITFALKQKLVMSGSAVTKYAGEKFKVSN